MTVKIKITVDKPDDAPFGYREQSFFIKLPDSTYGALLGICDERGISFQDLFLESITHGLDEFKERIANGREEG